MGQLGQVASNMESKIQVVLNRMLTQKSPEKAIIVNSLQS